jgi:hypothetical protein
MCSLVMTSDEYIRDRNFPQISLKAKIQHEFCLETYARIFLCSILVGRLASFQTFSRYTIPLPVLTNTFSSVSPTLPLEM